MAGRATKAKFDRMCDWARAQGFPVEKMGVFVDGTRMALLPPGASPVEGGAKEAPNEWDEVLPSAT